MIGRMIAGMAVLAALAGGPALAQGGPGMQGGPPPGQPPAPPPPGGHPPPPQAYADCRGKREGDRVTHTTPQGPTPATCMNSPEGMVARPDRPPPPAPPPGQPPAAITPSR